jgi:hypothetical protein
MSLRKSPRLTPGFLAAARRNAQHSSGPRTAAGKQNSKLNALKHGRYALPENLRLSRLRGMPLGEDPEEFQRLEPVPVTAAKL